MICGSLFTQVIPQFNVIKGDIEQSTGYYFINAFKTDNIAAGYRNMILDRYGEVVYTRLLPATGIDFKLHPNGMMSHCRAIINNPAALKFILTDSTFFIKDSVACVNGVLTDAHDLIILPNGHYLLKGFVYRTMNLSSYNWFNGNGSPGSTTAQVKCGVIQELDQNKNLVFSWNSADHYLFSDVQEEWLSSPTNVDWTHLNSVEVDTDGNLLLSVRHFSEVTKINRQTGAIMWRLGGKRNQFTMVNDPHNGFYGQHDARRITNGNITIFDNGKAGNPVHPARGIEYNINTQNMTATLVWNYQYSPTSYSMFMGGTRRLANGNSIIGWGRLQNRNVMFSTVKPDGGLIMEVQFTDSLFSYRAFNYPSLPWQLRRPQITCRDSAGGSYLDAPSGHASYMWSTGSTARSIRVTAADTYYVFVPYGQGGYISSERIIITNINNPCASLGITQQNSFIPEKFILEQNYPNPFNPSTKINFSIPVSGKVKLTIYDVNGKEVSVLADNEFSAGNYEAEWDASIYSSGVYFYKLETQGYINMKKMILLK